MSSTSILLERNGKKNLIISKRKISKIEKNEKKFLPTALKI